MGLWDGAHFQSHLPAPLVECQTDCRFTQAIPRSSTEPAEGSVDSSGSGLAALLEASQVVADFETELTQTFPPLWRHDWLPRPEGEYDAHKRGFVHGLHRQSHTRTPLVKCPEPCPLTQTVSEPPTRSGVGSLDTSDSSILALLEASKAIENNRASF